MKIYVLIIVCLYTLAGISKLAKSVNEENDSSAIASLIIIALGIMAIVFQSINL